MATGLCRAERRGDAAVFCELRDCGAEILRRGCLESQVFTRGVIVQDDGGGMEGKALDEGAFSVFSASAVVCLEGRQHELGCAAVGGVDGEWDAGGFEVEADLRADRRAGATFQQGEPDVAVEDSPFSDGPRAAVFVDLWKAGILAQADRAIDRAGFVCDRAADDGVVADVEGPVGEAGLEASGGIRRSSQDDEAAAFGIRRISRPQLVALCDGAVLDKVINDTRLVIELGIEPSAGRLVHNDHFLIAVEQAEPSALHSCLAAERVYVVGVGVTGLFRLSFHRLIAGFYQVRRNPTACFVRKIWREVRGRFDGLRHRR